MKLTVVNVVTDVTHILVVAYLLHRILEVSGLILGAETRYLEIFHFSQLRPKCWDSI